MPVPLAIHLLGAPRLERDGARVTGPRGNKAWALLAYLVASRHPPSRRKLAELLFSEAEDPLGSLRWSLAQLRGALGKPEALRGDPVELALAPGTQIDLVALRGAGARPPDTDALEGFSAELLEGMSFAGSPAFEVWLAVERRQVAATVEGLLLERAQAELAAERIDVAARLAARLVELNPLEEAHHELVVRCLLAAGDRAGALAAAERFEGLVRRELGSPPSSRIRELVRAAERPPLAASMQGASAVRAQLEAGRAAIAAGAIDSGLDALRAASAAARGCGDVYLQARAELTLGGALVHSMRAYGEAAPALHRAIEAARRVEARPIAATAYRELGFIDVQAGRREQAMAWLARAADAAGGADEELASIASVRAMAFADAARYEEAIEGLEESIERARRCEHRRQIAHALTHLGRVQLLLARHRAARDALEQALDLIEEEKWIAFAPLAEILLAHVEVAGGATDAARELLEHAFATSCHLGDPCWEALACRGLGLVEAAGDGRGRAIEWLLDGRARAVRIAHPYQWIHGWVLDALCRVGRDDGRAGGWIAELETLSSRTGMRELLVRAHLHRARRGDRGAREAARLLGAEIDNPSLWTDDPA